MICAAEDWSGCGAGADGAAGVAGTAPGAGAGVVCASAIDAQENSPKAMSASSLPVGFRIRFAPFVPRLYIASRCGAARPDADAFSLSNPEPDMNDASASRISRHPLAGRDILRMNGLGNEILVLDLRGAEARVTAADARAIGRAPGLGYDQMMVLYNPVGSDAVASMKIFNVDGSLSGACGNGTRCAGWALMRDTPVGALTLESDAGVLQVTREGPLTFTVDMGGPKLGWRDIPLAGAGGETVDVALTPPVAGAPDRFSAVSMGNPHAVFFVEDAQSVDLAHLGPRIETHPMFPDRVNASFAQMLSRDRILLRVWERGAGATRACGTAACATAVAAARRGLAGRASTVALPGGDLRIVWRESDDHVLMTGPVELEFETTLDPAIFAPAPT